MTTTIERRRWPRAHLRTEEVLRLELRHRVQLLDISQSGALIACEAAFPVRTCGIFRTGLGGLPFSAEVAVQRHHPKSPAPTLVALGTAFESVDERNMRHLEQFLQRGRNGGS